MTGREIGGIWAGGLVAGGVGVAWAFFVVTEFKLPLPAELVVGVALPLILVGVLMWLAVVRHD